MSQLIEDQNDAFRRGDQSIPGRVVLTHGIASLGETEIQAILAKVQAFDDFNEGNDPYGEHDFGRISHNEEIVYFKIDYYDPSLNMHSEDKTDLLKTVRVMTIMWSREY